MATAVVTGGSGFLGSHLCDYLLERGHRVICVDNLDTGSLQNVEHIRDRRFSFVNHDLVDHIELAEEVDYVFHLASPASPLDDKPITVFGDGSQTRSFCYVDDMIRGLYLLAMSDEHLPVNLGNPHELTLLELAQTVVRATSSKSEIVYEALPVDDPQVRQPDITRARQVLGWEPEVELEDGLKRMLPLEGREPVGV